MEEMYLIEYSIRDMGSGGGFSELDETKILIDEGVFRTRPEATARCVALARAKFDEVSSEFNMELASMGVEGPEIEISNSGPEGNTFRVEWEDMEHSWRVVSVTVN